MGGFLDRASVWLTSLFKGLVVLTIVLLAISQAERISEYATGSPIAGQNVQTTRNTLGMGMDRVDSGEIGWLMAGEIEPGGPADQAGIRVGDRIKFDEHLGHIQRWQPGDEIGLVIERSGETIPVTLTAQPIPERLQQSFVSVGSARGVSPGNLIGGLLQFALAIFLLVRGRGNTPATMLGLFLLVLGGALDLSLVTVPHWLNSLAKLLILPVGAGVGLYFLRFEFEISGGAASPTQRRLVNWLGALFAGYFFLLLITGTLAMPVGFPIEAGSGFLFVANQACGLGFILWNYRRNDAAARNRIKLAASAMPAYVILSVIQSSLIVPNFDPSVAEGTEFIVRIVPIGMLAYAVLKQRLFDFGFAINRTLVYGAAAFTLLVTFGLVEYGAKSMIPVAWPTAGPFISAGIAVLLFLSFHRLHHWFEHHIERFFFKEWQENEAALKRFVHSATHFDQAASLCREFAEELRRFAGGSGAALYLREEDSTFRLAAGGIEGAQDHYAEESRVFAAMRSERRPIDLTRIHNPLPGELALPMLDQLGLAGFVLVAAKAEGTHYRPDEVEVLGWAAHQVGLDLQALEARRLRAEVAGLREKLLWMAEQASKAAKASRRPKPA